MISQILLVIIILVVIIIITTYWHLAIGKICLQNKQKIEAIINFQKYELLDNSQIDLQMIITLLYKSSLVNYDVIHLLDTIYTSIYYKRINDNWLDSNIVIIINNYYPYFDCTIFTNTNYYINSGKWGYNYATDVFNMSHPYKNISVGTQVVVGNDLKLLSNDLTNNSTVITKIEYKLGNKIYNIDKLNTYINCVIHPIINKIGKIWTINKIRHKIKFYT